MSNLPSNSLQEVEHNLQEMKTKSPAWSSKGYHMYDYQGDFFKIQGQFKDKLHFLDFQEFSRTKFIFMDFSRSVRTLWDCLEGKNSIL